jgi:hypothetical protein
LDGEGGIVVESVKSVIEGKWYQEKCGVDGELGLYTNPY